MAYLLDTNVLARLANATDAHHAANNDSVRFRKEQLEIISKIEAS